jgi:hypothetical protein
MAIIRKTIPGLKPGSDYLFTLKPKNVEIAAADSEQDTIRVNVPLFAGTPSVITGLQLASSFQTVIFKFDPVNDLDLAYFEYQLYDNELGSGNPINATTSASNESSTLISGTSAVNIFLVDVDNSTEIVDPVTNTTTTVKKEYWGRVRSVNTSGNPSTQWTTLVACGELDLIDDQFIGNLTAAKITSGTIDAAQITLAGSTSSIKSSLYNPSDPIATRQGWIIKGDGTAEFSSASIRGTISAQSIFLNSNNRWGRNSANTADSNEFKVGTTSSYLFYDVANNKVTFTGELSAATGTFSGSLSAASGTFSSYITAGVTQIGKNVRDAADHNGIALDSGSWNNAWVRRGGDGSVYFRAGTATKYIQMDTQTGATSAISFPNFSVDNNGSITATSANISGTVTSGNLTATGGTIAGWTISSSSISAGGTTISSNGTITIGINSDSALRLNSGSDISMFASSGGTSSIFYYRDGYSGTQWDSKLEQSAAGNLIVYGNDFAGGFYPTFIVRSYSYAGGEFRTFDATDTTETLAVTRAWTTTAGYNTDIARSTQMLQFFKKNQNNASLGVGYIRTGGSTTVPSFAAGSDVRLKKNIKKYETNLIKDIKNINIYTWNDIHDIDNKNKVIGFLAKEFYPNYTDVVTGKPDEIDENGNPVYMNMSREDLIPHMFGVIKFLVNKVEELESKIVNG